MSRPFPRRGRPRSSARAGESRAFPSRPRTHGMRTPSRWVSCRWELRPSEAQSAGQILEQALERHEERLSGVEDLTLRQEVLGFPTTAYMVKEMVGGRPILSTRSVDVGGAGIDAGELSGDLWGDPGRLYEEWGSRWSLEGQATVAGVSAWRLSLTNFEGLDFPDPCRGRISPSNPPGWFSNSTRRVSSRSP
jgi:hypothetical protein